MAEAALWFVVGFGVAIWAVIGVAWHADRRMGAGARLTFTVTVAGRRPGPVSGIRYVRQRPQPAVRPDEDAVGDAAA
jgi:hypothetical protein